MKRIQYLLILLLCALPVLTCAADSALTPQDPPLSQSAQVALTILGMLGSVITALLAWVGVHASSWLKAKSKNETVGGMLARTSDMLFALIREAEQTAVYELRKARDPRSPGGAVITQSEGKQIKEAVITKFKELWGPKGLEELAKVLGLTSDGLTKYLNAKVEEACLVENARNPP